VFTASPLIPIVGAGHAPQLKEMIQKGDHAALAEFYKKRRPKRPGTRPER